MSPKSITLKPGEFLTYRLTVPGGGDLHGYLFMDEQHAQRWAEKLALAAGAAVPTPPAGPEGWVDVRHVPWQALNAVLVACAPTPTGRPGAEAYAEELRAELLKLAARYGPPVSPGAPPAGLTVETLAALLVESRYFEVTTQADNLAAWLLPRLSVSPGAPPAALEKIVQVMRDKTLPDDLALSEIQDHLTIAGYDVPLRSYRDAPAPPASAGAPPAALIAATEAMIAKLDACEPYIRSAFLLQELHGARYDGPSYAVELAALRAALAAAREPKP